MFLGQAVNYKLLCAIAIFLVLLIPLSSIAQETAAPSETAPEPIGEYESCPDVLSTPPKVPDIITLTKEAKSGSAGAGYELANLYAEQKNYKDAEKWYRFALYKGEGRAAISLYDLNNSGALKVEDAEAIKKYGITLIEQSAAKGGGSAAMNLAFIYLYGEGGTKDYDKAHDWFIAAENAGKPMASYQLGILYSNGLHFEISPRLAFHYFEKAAAAGIAPATRQVAIAYHTGIGAAKDIDKAITCYERAAKQGDMLAMRDLGNIYRFERPDMGQSAAWLEKAAEKGDADAHYILGMTKKNSNPGAARAHFLAAAKQKHHLARIEVDPDYVPHEKPTTPEIVPAEIVTEPTHE
jgi:TPR repeat protein